MNSNDGEAACLRKQIQFLESLISNAEAKKTKPEEARKHVLNQTSAAQYYRSRNSSDCTSLNATTRFRARVKGMKSYGESRKPAQDQTLSSKIWTNKSKYSSAPTYRNFSTKYTAGVNTSTGYAAPTGDVDQTVSSQYIKSKHNSDFSSRNTLTKYNWKPNRSEDGSDSYSRLSNTQRNQGPFSVTRGSIHSSQLGSQNGISYNNHPSQAKDKSHLVPKLPEACGSSDLNNGNKAKTKSQFTWNRQTIKEKNVEALHVKNKFPSKNSAIQPASDLNTASDIEFGKSKEVKECDQYGPQLQSTCSNIKSIPNTTSLPHRTVAVKSTENTQYLALKKPPKPDALQCTKLDVSSSKTDGITSEKHMSLQNEILKTQSKLESLKRKLLINTMKSQNKNTLAKDKTKNTCQKYSNTLIHPRHKTVKPYHQYHRNRAVQQQYYNYIHSNKKYWKPWVQRYTSVGWKSKYYPRKLHQPYNFTGRYSQGLQNKKYKHGPRSHLLYGMYGYQGRKFDNTHKNFNFNKTRFNTYKYGLITKVDIRRRIDRMKRLRDEVPFDPKMKLDRRRQEGNTARQKFVMINGMLYKTSKKSLIRAPEKECLPSHTSAQSGASSRVKFMSSTAMKTVTVRGVKFKVDRDGKSLKRLDSQRGDGANVSALWKAPSSISRVDIGGVTYRQTKPGTLERMTTRKSSLVAKKVLNRTVAQMTTRHKKDRHKKDNTKTSTKQQYCVFYNRFGKCNRKDKCPFIHDPDRVAICTRFLRGTCKVKACPFSHKVSQEKMPVCSYFLKGVCNKVDCPYLHVNVNRDAEICPDFVDGFCSLGTKCTKKHTLVCPVFAKTGTCPEGKTCRLQHRRSKHRRQSGSGPEQSKAGDKKQSSSFRLIEKETGKETEDTSLSFEDKRLPAYISLISKPTNNSSKDGSKQGTSIDQNKVADTKVMKIRPQL